MITNVLDGVRVIDLSRFGAGPYCGWLLARMGAEVIRVEPPRGDFDRYFSVLTKTGDNTMFLTWVSGKKSATLDLEKGGKAWDLFTQLLEKADVVLESLGVDVAEKWGVTYENLRRIKPDIIMSSTTACGSTGPLRQRVGFDSTGQAMSGAMSVTGPPDMPTKNSLAHIDFMTGSHAAIGVVAALMNRYKTGKGQLVETSLLRTGILISGYLLAEPGATGRVREPRRIGSRTSWICFGDVCTTKDGKMVYVGVVGPMMKRIFKIMGREDMAKDPRFANDTSCFDHRHILDPIIKDWIASLTLAELEELAQKIRISVSPILDYTEVADHPQVKAENLLVPAHTSDGSFGMNVPAFPVKFSDEMFTEERKIPRLGENNEEVWGRLCGLSSDELAKLKAEGII